MGGGGGGGVRRLGGGGDGEGDGGGGDRGGKRAAADREVVLRSSVPSWSLLPTSRRESCSKKSAPSVWPSIGGRHRRSEMASASSIARRGAGDHDQEAWMILSLPICSFRYENAECLTLLKTCARTALLRSAQLQPTQTQRDPTYDEAHAIGIL